jgi:hypothetical protein
MEHGMETFRTRFGIESLGEFSGESAPEWQALKARFAAALEVRRELGRNGPALPSGSFDAASARFVNAYEQTLSDVNRTALGNGKSGDRISGAFAGEPISGGRG